MIKLRGKSGHKSQTELRVESWAWVADEESFLLGTIYIVYCRLTCREINAFSSGEYVCTSAADTS